MSASLLGIVPEEFCRDAPPAAEPYSSSSPKATAVAAGARATNSAEEVAKGVDGGRTAVEASATTGSRWGVIVISVVDSLNLVAVACNVLVTVECFRLQDVRVDQSGMRRRPPPHTCFPGQLVTGVRRRLLVKVGTHPLCRTMSW